MSANPFYSSPSSFPTFANPFAAAPAQAPEAGVTPAGDPQGARYALVVQAPRIAAEEVEEAHIDALEVQVRWGDNVLGVSHLSPPRAFTIGEGGDFVVDAAKEEVVRVNGAVTTLIVPPGASLSVTMNGATRQVAIPESREVALALVEGAEITLGQLSVQVKTVRAGKKIAKAGFFSSLGSAAPKTFGLSSFLHLGIVASLAFFMPRMGEANAEELSRDNLLMMQKLVNASQQRELERIEETGPQESESPQGGQPGEKAAGEQGMAGSQTSKNTNGALGVKGPHDNPNPELARKQEIAEASTFGMIGMLNSFAESDPKAPTAPWGADSPLGRDDKSALGNMWGDSIDDAFGMGGLGPSGAGEGGGGKGKGIGLMDNGGIGSLGNCTVGPCKGLGPGGIGTGSSPLRGGHVAKAPPPIREFATEVNGRLAPEVIQRIVRQNFGKFRFCYEAGLRENPALAGRVVTRFVIDRTGAVAVAQDAGSDMPNQAVVSCIVSKFQNLSFPEPQGGVVKVVYPLAFTPE